MEGDSSFEPQDEEGEGEGRGSRGGCSACPSREPSRGLLDGEHEGSTCTDFLRNFRELLYFHHVYYSTRGRDRLSLEFSSHIPYAEWFAVVQMLCADDGGPTALLDAPIPLPRSPYCLPPRRPRHHTLRMQIHDGTWR
jgi:hypothetical protein